ncbi:redoxin domain-containing protein [Acidisphaera sp. L21]|uniref:redoxin domain-containing protein n=1 Tax=Acidisphaera sp. L21 TaxID=1641851 RepID=UPI0020B1765E|nr:redoxin domain-containing protein [Acidisphaera sp. L21]
MALQDKLDSIKAAFVAKVPADIRAIMDGGTDALIATGQAERAVKAGDRAPSFILPDPDGKLVASADLLLHGPLVVTFYRGAWCPYCNTELQALEENAAQIRGMGAICWRYRSRPPPIAGNQSGTTNSASRS